MVGVTWLAKENIINEDFYNYHETINSKLAYKILNNRLDASIIRSLAKYRPDIEKNSILIIIARMTIEVPAKESAAGIIVRDYIDIKFIQPCSKEAFHEYIKNIKKKI